MKLKLSLSLGVAALMFAFAPRAAHADLEYWSAALFGTWKHPRTGDLYRFNSNATYTLTYAKVGEQHRAATSGWWKIVQPTQKESGGSQEGPVALLLKQRKVTFLEPHGQKRTENRKKDYRLVVNTVETEAGSNRNLYWIDGAQWKRVNSK